MRKALRSALKKESRRCGKMIEDAMIAANETVARFLEATGHTSVYRIHDHPDGDKLLSLKR